MEAKPIPLHAVLTRSSALANHLEVAFQLPPFEENLRFRTSVMAGSVALEHGEGVRALLALRLGISAAVLLRAQYEATLRAIWVCYAAKDEEVLLLSGNLTAESERRAKGLPQAGDMLCALERTAPAPAVQPLRNFRTHSWAALNSFVHAGIHSLNRHEKGLPWPVIEGALRSSNGLSVMAAMQCAVATGSQALVRQIAEAQLTFADCLPEPVELAAPLVSLDDV